MIKLRSLFISIFTIHLFIETIPLFRRNLGIIMNLKNKLLGIKQIIFIRHGTTEMNEALSLQPWGSKNFRDIGLWDTLLSSKGCLQCQQLNNKLKGSNPKIPLDNLFDEYKSKVIVSSPLTRALQTSEYIFKDISFINRNDNNITSPVNKVACELFTERLYLSSDVGKKTNILEKEFPNWDFSNITKDNWWYETNKENYKEWRPNDGAIYLCPGEPTDVFRNRLIMAREWLLSRPEDLVVVTAHWGVIRGLTGQSFDNCEARLYQSDQLLSEPFIDSD